jgi:DNA-binding beta-propeller fold protein YncE
MRRRSLFRHTRLELIVLALALSGVGIAQAKKKKHRRPPEPHFIHDDFFGMGRPVLPDFQVEGAGLREGLTPSERAARLSSGSSLIAHPGGFFALDRGEGQLIATDTRGMPVARLAVGSDSTTMVYDADAQRLWVADHGGDRVVAVRISGSAEGLSLSEEKSLTVHAPWGLALHPDGRRLFVTSSVEGSVRQIDTHVMKTSWERRVGPEPRPVAVSPDGSRLMVGFLTLGATAELALGAEVEATPREVVYHSIDPEKTRGSLGAVMPIVSQEQQAAFQQRRARPGRRDPAGAGGRSFARNSFALAYLGADLAVVPHQLSTPIADNTAHEDRGGYGGGGDFSFPITHRLTYLRGEDTQTRRAAVDLAVHQPRALAYDAGADRLYVVGYGDDVLVAIDEATQATMHLGYKVPLQAAPTEGGPAHACGADGIAVQGGRVAVHCSLQRSVRVLSESDGSVRHEGVELVASTRTEAADRGEEVFRRGGDPRISTLGAMACASCHPEGLTDGLSWRIQGRELQTPLITGRLVGTHPFKWDGQDKDLPSSLRNTVGRLGGSGLSEGEADDLQAFLESLPSPRTPLARRAHALERGRALFESPELACDACHSGSQFADGQMHALASDLPQVDTPSLLGLARSAPYYHDGSAPTLRALLLDNGQVHGMSSTSDLSPEQMDDLITYLESL